VGEVATVVGIDEATLSWDCLEFARCQVRLLKSCKADFSRDFRTNGSLYNITVVEEAVKSGGADFCCKCAFHNEGSSNSSSSVESFVADSLVSEKFSEDEDGSEERYGRPEKATGGGEGRSTTYASKAMDKECSERHESCQQKSGLFSTRKDLCMQGVSVERTCVSDTQRRVSDACAALHQSMVSLVEVVEAVSNARPRPISIEAQTNGSCTQNLECHYANRVLAQTQELGGAGRLSTAESTKEEPSTGVGNKGDAFSQPSLEETQIDVATNCNEVEVEKAEGEMGNEEALIAEWKAELWWKIVSHQRECGT